MRVAHVSVRLHAVFTVLSAHVYAANPNTNGLFSLVGCDGYDIDGAIQEASDMATAAANLIDTLLNSKGFDDYSPLEEQSRLATFFWGIEMEALDNGQFRVPGSGYGTLSTAKARYLKVADALTGSRSYFNSYFDYIFCSTSPFVKIPTYGQFYKGVNPALYDVDPIIDNRVFWGYPAVGYDSKGWLRISFAGTPNTDICSPPQGFTQAPVATTKAFGYANIGAATGDSKNYRNGQFIVLCPPYTGMQSTLGKLQPDTSAFDLDLFKSQSGVLLHEVFHAMFPDVLDIPVQFANNNSPLRAYDMVYSAFLALGLTKSPGGSLNALRNADNYRLFALGAFLPARPWSLQKTLAAQGYT